MVVRDSEGRPASYNARLFADTGVRYLTPRDSERADKDAVFGEHLWPPMSERGLVYAAEGSFKVLALERATHAPVASLGGSELRPAHARKLATFRKVVWVRDSGPAGEKIATAVETAIARHAELVHVALPGTEDADSMGLEELRKCLFAGSAA
jgi:hypothetical protein